MIRKYSSSLGGPDGPPLVNIPLGLVVTVTLQITSPDELSNLLVEDLQPGGLEPLDPNAAGEAPVLRSQSGMCPWWWWRCTSFQRQTRSRVVSFYSSWVAAGTHTLEYEAIATTRGHFVLPPAKASLVMEPEVMGLSAGGAFQVVDKAELAQAKPVETRLKCPAECSGQGICEHSTGHCVCYPPHAGSNCSEIMVTPWIGGLVDDKMGDELKTTTELAIHTMANVLTGGRHPTQLVIAITSSRPASYTYALSGNAALLPSNSLRLESVSPSSLALYAAKVEEHPFT